MLELRGLQAGYGRAQVLFAQGNESVVENQMNRMIRSRFLA